MGNSFDRGFFPGGPGWYSGGQGAFDSPAVLEVSIGDHPYIIEPTKYRRQTIEALRPAMDQAPEPGEVSLNNAGLWRRSQSDQRLGSNQLMFDEMDSKRTRYWTSKGLNPHPDTPANAYQLRLHKDTYRGYSSTNSNLGVFYMGTHLVVVDGAEIYTVTISGTTWTSTALGFAAATTNITLGMVAFDGFYVYAIAGSTGVWRVPITGGTVAHWSVHPMEMIGYANGQLLGSHLNTLYQFNASGQDMDDSGVTGLLKFTHSNPNFTWSQVTGTPHGIFVSGNSGVAGEMYRIDVDAQTSALIPPVSMFVLPVGEALNAITYYSGALILATNLGVRVAQVQIMFTISVQYGPLLQIPGGCAAMAGAGEWCWFSWSNYDQVSTGLGRLDLARFALELTPAMSSDLMAGSSASPQQGVVQSVAVAGGGAGGAQGPKYFAVSGSGIWAEHPTNYVASGSFNTGWIKYGTTEKKLGMAVDLYHDPLPAGSSILPTIIDEENVQSPPQASSNVAGSVHPNGLLALGITNPSEQVQLNFTISNGTDVTKPPVLRRWTLYALVTPRRVDEIDVPIKLHRKVKIGGGDGTEKFFDVAGEYAYLKGLEASGQPVTYTEGGKGYQCYVDQITIEGAQWVQPDHEAIEGLYTVRLITIDPGA